MEAVLRIQLVETVPKLEHGLVVMRNHYCLSLAHNAYLFITAHIKVGPSHKEENNPRQKGRSCGMLEMIDNRRGEETWK